MYKIGFRPQRTIRQAVEICGHGFISGAAIKMRLRPAPPDTGIVFLRTDLKGSLPLAAHATNVTGTSRRTTLGRAPGQVELVEHVLAALAGLRIDNCLVELNGSEPPGLDGSSHAFVQSLFQAGVIIQPARRNIWAVKDPITVSEGGATLTLHPATTGQLRISYLLDYGANSPIGVQRHTEDITPASYAQALGNCRTFLLEAEAEALKRQGLGARATLSDLVVFGPHGPIGNRLRYGNEPARHKALDILGDLSLFGEDLAGHVVAYRSGHSLNVQLVQRLLEELQKALPSQQKSAA